MVRVEARRIGAGSHLFVDDQLVASKEDCPENCIPARPDVTGTEDGLAQYPYIRGRGGSARIHGVRAARGPLSPARSVLAEPFPDSVGVGYYRIDLHPSTGGDNYVDVASLPFQVPLGALIPVGSRTSCRRRRTSVPPIITTAAIGSIRWSGTSAKRPGRWPPLPGAELHPARGLPDAG